MEKAVSRFDNRGDRVTTNRITVDIDGSFFTLLHSLLRCLVLCRIVPFIRKTSKGYHLWFYLPQNVTDREMYRLRLLLFDDKNRVRLDMKCKFKPKQVLFDEKKVIDLEERKVVKHQIL